MVVIRLSRAGTNKRPFYHMVVADRRKPRDGRYIEQVGYFNPIAQGKEVPLFIQVDRLQYWVSVGAQPSDRVKTLFKKYTKQSSETAATEKPKAPKKATKVKAEAAPSTDTPAE